MENTHNHAGYTIRAIKGVNALELGALWRYKELLYFLVWRELKIRYKQAAIGAGWAIIQPLLTVLIFTLIFGLFARMPSDGLPYPVFAFTAILPWTYFSEAMRRSSTGIVDDSELIRKIYFPRLILPMAMVTAPVVDFILTFIVLLILMAYYGIAPTWGVLALPLFMLLTMGLALAIGLWLGPVNVRFRDVRHTLPFLIQIWMYASPIVYPMSIIPEKYRLFYSLNPIVGVIEGFRWALLGTARPDFTAMFVSAALVAVLLVAGLIYFKKKESYFADVI